MSDNALADHIAVEQLSEWTFQSKHLAERMGNTLPIAYGGYTIGTAIKAAAKTVPDGFHLYSAQGNYLGPASITEKVTLTVFPSRSTKTFQTRRVRVSQTGDDGKPRLCMEMLADFQRAEPAELLNYSAPPTMKYSHWKDCVPIPDLQAQLVATGKTKDAEVKAFNKIFGVSLRLFNDRYCPEAVTAQNLYGVAKHVQTTQDHLPITSKTTAQWFKARHPVHEESDHVAGLGFALDAALSFIPLTYSHMFLDDAGSCASLDFSMRVFVPNVNINEYNLRENVTHVGGHGRTYSEARVWDEDGNLVASMTQQSIMRPQKGNNKL